MSIVVCKMPKAGLGNQLFPLMKAVLLHKQHEMPLFVLNGFRLSIGPYLRGEKSKRRYSGYFTFQKGYLGQLVDTLRVGPGKLNEVREFSLHANPSVSGSLKYVYAAMPHWDDYFNELKDFRTEVIESFYALLASNIVSDYQVRESPQIGVHIRMGDFRKLREGESFAAVGAVRTPLTYFADVINGIRKMAGKTLPVTIFTDGYRHELKELLALDEVNIAEGNWDIVDLILLSKSKVIVTSAGSTFSYWAGFLSDAALIMHPDHVHASIRPNELAGKLYEGIFDPDNEVLLKNIQAISE